MDLIENLKAYLAVARTGSFAAAARELEVAPSVITKRISQVEWRLKTTLFERSTRRVSLTTQGVRLRPSVQRAVADIEDLFVELPASGAALQGRLRVKAPGTLAVLLLGPIFERFQKHHPLVSIELLTLDRPVNPVDEGFDVAFTLMPNAFAGVIEEPLCPMPRTLCASPAYIARNGSPSNPSELAQHDILNFLPTGTSWLFDSVAGEVQVSVQPRLNTNEGQLILSAALSGHGIARLSSYLCESHLRADSLVPVLEGYPVKQLWLKALVPESRIQVARVQELLRWTRSELGGSLAATR
jgi:DNA-binding transcriptional LysR family regulator